MRDFHFKKPLPPQSRLVLIAALALIGGLGFFTWQHLYPVTAAKGWSYRVFIDEVPYVSALAKDRQGVLYVTQEVKNEGGSVFTLAADGRRSPLLAGLSKPDGLVPLHDGMVVSQEAGEQPVLWMHAGQSEALFSGTSVEGMASDGQFLYVIEDRASDGRLLRFDPVSKLVAVLRDGLREGEGIAVCPDGQLYYTEKGYGWVKRWRSEGQDERVLSGLKAPGFLMCNEEGLWVSEDATHLARLLLLDSSGSLQVILRHLRSAQSVLSLAPGQLLIAEQGRARILEIKRADKRPD